MDAAAKRTGDPLAYLHRDHLGSVVLSTYASTGTRFAERGYYAFGGERHTYGAPLTDQRFTGQKLDESGLYDFNARYYDPAIGQFVSPDTVVADPEHLFDYDRYMAFRGDPLRYGDPTGRYSDHELLMHFGVENSDFSAIDRGSAGSAVDS